MSAITSADGFHHLVYSISGTTHTLFLDGSAVSVNTNGTDVFSAFPNISNLLIGTAGDLSFGYTGFIDDFKVFNRVLGSTDVSAIYNANLKPTEIPFTPTSISGLTNWYDGSDPNANGILPSNGTTISTWKDKSTNANNMIAQTAGTYTYANNSQNGLGTVTFNNSWYRTATANATYPFDVYVVVKLNSTTNAADVIGSGSNNSDNFNSLTFGEHTAGRWHNGSSGFSRTPNAVSSTSETSTSFLLMQWSIANNNFYIYRNGVQIMSTTSYTWGGPSNQEFRLGNRYYTTANIQLQGSIAEVLFYNSQLQTSNRQKVEGYLAWKWGLQTNLPTTHPYYTLAPKINTTQKPINLLSTVGYNQLVGTGTTLQAGAFGVKLLLYSARNNPVIQIKAGTSGTPTDFYATTDGLNITTAPNGGGTGIVAFLNGATGYVTKWYDQTGNGHHATATGSPLPTFDTTKFIVDFGTSGYFSLADNSFPTGNLPYTYIYNQGNLPPSNATYNISYSGGSAGAALMDLLIINNGSASDAWYSADAGGASIPANSVVATTYGGGGNNNGATGKLLYVNNINKPLTYGGLSGNRNQTSVNCYLGFTQIGGGAYSTYQSTMSYFYWMPYQLSPADIAILGST